MNYTQIGAAHDDQAFPAQRPEKRTSRATT